MTHKDLQKPMTGPEYDDRDVRVGVLVIAIVFCVLFTALALLGVRLWFSSLDRSASKAAATPWAEAPAERVLPPDPMLQVTPSADLAEHRAKEEELLNSYKVIDKDAGVVRIPIDRAMDLVAEEGLPVGAPPPEEPTAETESEPATEEPLPPEQEPSTPEAAEHDHAEP